MFKMDCQKKHCQIIKITGKKIRKMTIPPKQAMKHAYSVSSKNTLVNSDMSLKTIINQNVLNENMINKCFKIE